MKNTVSQHVMRHLSADVEGPTHQRRLDDFVRMLGEREFQLVNAIEGEADRFYNAFDEEPRFLFLFEAYRCSDPDCGCLVYEETHLSSNSDKDLRLAEYIVYLQRFNTKCKASGHKDVLPQLAKGKTVLPGLVHGAWLATTHRSRPADISTHLLVPVGIQLEFGLSMIYDAVDQTLCPL